MRRNSADDEGSAVTGFALVAPLLVAVFICLTVVVSIVRHQAVLGAAASTGARVASAYDSTDAQGRVAVTDLVQAHGYNAKRVNITISHPVVNGVRLVQVVVGDGVHVPWINRDIGLSQSARAVDEQSLQ